jgi:IclR family transcriptional regulator, acetate operon repressor
MTAYTLQTCTDRAALLAQVERARQVGYAIADRSYEEDVVGFAAPVFGPHQTAVGPVAVACPSHRWTDELQARLYKAVLDSAVTLSRAMGNEPPKSYLQLLNTGAGFASGAGLDRSASGATA